MAELQLKLVLPRTKILRGESLPFTVSLTNRGAAPIKLLSLTYRNAPLTLTATDASGKTVEGNEQSISAWRGEAPPHNRAPSQVTLAPGSSVEQSADALAWLGELPAGEHTLVANYADSPPVTAESNSIKFTISNPSPVGLFNGGDAARLTYAPRRLVWLNQDEKEKSSVAYLLELDALAPTVALANRPLAEFDGSGPALISWSPVEPPPEGHVLWRGKANRLRVLKLAKSGLPTSSEIPLPDPGLELFGQPFCDKEGGLVVALQSGDGFKGALMRLAAAGAPAVTGLQFNPPLTSLAALTWSRKDELLVVWDDPQHHGVHALVIPISARTPPNARRVLSAPSKIKHLRVDEIYRERNSSFVTIATVLCHDDINDIFHRLRVNLQTDKLETQESFKCPGSGRLRVLSSSMLQDGTVAYLFVNPENQVVYGPPDLEKPKPLEVTFKVPITLEHSPTLVASSPLASARGFYLCFLANRQRIERRAMQ